MIKLTLTPEEVVALNNHLGKRFSSGPKPQSGSADSQLQSISAKVAQIIAISVKFAAEELINIGVSLNDSPEEARVAFKRFQAQESKKISDLTRANRDVGRQGSKFLTLDDENSDEPKQQYPQRQRRRSRRSS